MTYKNILYKGCAAVCLIGTMASMVSCNDEMVSPEMNEKVLISDINLDVTPVLPLLVGSDTILNYSVLSENASDKGVIWKSGSPEIASVDEEGRIKAVHAGTAIISVMPAVGFAVTSTVEIKVVDEIIFIEDINLDMTENELEVYETASLQLRWQTIPSDPTYPTLKWESLTPEIATVTEDGVVKGVKAGTARVKATATDGKHFTKEFTITVKPIIFIETLSFVKESDKLALGEVYVPQLNVKPGNATLSALKWESSKPEVVEVDENGHFIAKKYGTAVVTATADYGDGNPISASMNVIVAEGKMNDSFEFMNSWENFNGQCLEFNWLEDQGILSLFPGADKNYKAIRIKRTGGFEFNVANYPILAFKVRFPKDVFEVSEKMEWYLDMWGGLSSGGKYGADTNKGNKAMEVLDCGDYKVFYADFTKKKVNTEMMPTKLQKVDNVVFEIWKIWYEADETGTIDVDWIKTFESEEALKSLINEEKK